MQNEIRRGKLVFVKTGDGEFYGAKVVRVNKNSIVVRAYYGSDRRKERKVSPEQVTLQDGQ